MPCTENDRIAISKVNKVITRYFGFSTQTPLYMNINKSQSISTWQDKAIEESTFTLVLYREGHESVLQ